MIILAIDIGGTAIKYGLVDDDNNIINFNEVPSGAKSGADVLINNLYKIIDTMCEKYDAISVSTAGRVDSDNGIITYANENIPNYSGTNLRKLLADRYKKPVFVENDVYCAAIAESNYGSGVKSDNFLCLTVGTGIGGAIVINNEIYKGSNCCAGDFGEIIINGKRFESAASASALTELVYDKIGIRLSGREIFSSDYFSNSEIKKCIDEWIENLFLGIKNLIYIFDPKLIIIGGGIMNESYIIESLKLKINNVNRDNFGSVVITQAALKNKAGMIGAAHIARNG